MASISQLNIDGVMTDLRDNRLPECKTWIIRNDASDSATKYLLLNGYNPGNYATQVDLIISYIINRSGISDTSIGRLYLTCDYNGTNAYHDEHISNGNDACYVLPRIITYNDKRYLSLEIKLNAQGTAILYCILYAGNYNSTSGMVINSSEVTNISSINQKQLIVNKTR